jgi:hypothetical protein
VREGSAGASAIHEQGYPALQTPFLTLHEIYLPQEFPTQCPVLTMSSLTKPVEPLYPPDPLFALVNSSIPCEKGRDGVTMLRHWGLHETLESAVDLALRRSISTSHSHRGNTFEFEEIAAMDELQLRVTEYRLVNAIKVLTANERLLSGRKQ